jgi:hypothetical protein
LDIIGADRGQIFFFQRMFDVIQEGEGLQRICTDDPNVDIPVRKQALMCMRALGHYENDLLKGALELFPRLNAYANPNVIGPFETAAKTLQAFRPLCE